MVEVVNMLPPPYMLPAKAPKPVPRSCCVITGKPAVYRDPASGHAYADLAAYKELKQRWESKRQGKTGKRTKRQRTSSLPLASLDEQALQAMQEGPPQPAVQHLAPDAADTVNSLQTLSATGLSNAAATDAEAAIGTQPGQCHIAAAGQAGPLRDLTTAGDVPVLPAAMPLATPQTVADSQQSPNIVSSEALPVVREAVPQGLLAAAPPPASAVLLHQ